MLLTPGVQKMMQVNLAFVNVPYVYVLQYKINLTLCFLTPNTLIISLKLRTPPLLLIHRGVSFTQVYKKKIKFQVKQR